MEQLDALVDPGLLPEAGALAERAASEFTAGRGTEPDARGVAGRAEGGVGGTTEQLPPQRWLARVRCGGPGGYGATK